MEQKYLCHLAQLPYFYAVQIQYVKQGLTEDRGLQTKAPRSDPVYGESLPHCEWHGLFHRAATGNATRTEQSCIPEIQVRTACWGM